MTYLFIFYFIVVSTFSLFDILFNILNLWKRNFLILLFYFFTGLFNIYICRYFLQEECKNCSLPCRICYHNFVVSISLYLPMFCFFLSPNVLVLSNCQCLFLSIYQCSVVDWTKQSLKLVVLKCSHPWLASASRFLRVQGLALSWMMIHVMAVACLG